MGWVSNTNLAIGRSAVGRYFHLAGSGHPKERKDSFFFTEIRAGLATFFAMAYIIAVNSQITSLTGGTCVCPAEFKNPDIGCDKSPEYMSCVEDIKRDLVTATAAIAALATFCMGLFANIPLAVAPGMGTNAYFTFNVVGPYGSGKLKHPDRSILIPNAYVSRLATVICIYSRLGAISYELALMAVFVEGLVFVALTLFGIRQWLARVIPASIKLATGVGIGLYLTLIGLTYDAGIGLITGSMATPVTLGGCKEEDKQSGVCPGSHKMQNPTMWIGIFCGGFLTTLLMAYRVKGAIIAGILLVSIISWPRSTSVSYFPHDPLGDQRFDFFKKVVSFHSIQKTLAVPQWDVSQEGAQFGLAFITFLYVDILDCTGTLYSMARFAGLINPRTQDFEGSSVAYLVDATSISIGALFGSPPSTAFIESGAGISEGGKTGITAMTTGLCFFVSIFFAPIFASIPPWATGCTLIIVGCLMAQSAKDINWSYIGDAVPAFLTIAIMPFTYSIAYGLIAGIVSYAIINTIIWIIEKASGGRIVPDSKSTKEPWSYKVPGGILPPWLKRLKAGKKTFWKDDDTMEDGVPHTTGMAERRSESSGEPIDTKPMDATPMPKTPTKQPIEKIT
ncbi:permease [Massarina eburnea CBS 473.64]|uniref:Permease n=1 Tax=Massarina eburnea CBS 473.64 TaxID=1395130 RepID=A0A6A6S4J1_9PLEO|nr:permease [Massarina eburnea CBS 473.64]